MSSRYEPPEQAERRQAADSATMWDALSSGADPTGRPGEAAAQRGPD
jgi:hypothetical protein